MAIDNTKLIFSPVLQQAFIDPITKAPVSGKLYFYAKDTTTPKPVYRTDGTGTYIPENTVTLDSAGAIPYGIWFYPYDDKGNVQLYDVVLKRLSDNTIAWSRKGVPENKASSGGGGVSDNTETVNLLPSYGFESPLYDGIYANTPITQDTIAIALGWKYSAIPYTAAKSTFSFSSVMENNLVGNPRNALTLKTTNSTTGETAKYIETELGHVNQYQNKKLVLSLIAKAAPNQTDTITVNLVREKNGVRQAPIALGKINLNQTYEQHILELTFPALGSGFVPTDKQYLQFSFPLNQDMEVAITGTWLTFGTKADLIIPEVSPADTLMRQMFGSPDRNFAHGSNQKLPLVITQGGIGVDDIAAMISISTTNYRIPGYLRLADGQALVANRIIDGVSTNRIINALRTRGITQSDKTFIASRLASGELQITTGRAVKQYADWTITNQGGGSRITFKSGSNGKDNAFSMKVKASLKIAEYVHVSFMFTENGLVKSQIQQPNPTGTPLFSGGYIDGEINGNSVIANYYATLSYDGRAYSSTSAQFLLQTFVNVRNAGSASTKASYAFYFYPTLFRTLDIPGKHSLGDKNNNLFRSYHWGDNYWLKSRDLIYKENGVNYTYAMGYFGWNGPGATPPALPNYEYTVGFSVDGDKGKFIPNANKLKRVVEINAIDDYLTIAKKLVDTINNPTVQNYTFSASPNTGDKFTLDLGEKDLQFEVIYVVGIDSKPAPSAGFIPIYVAIPQNDDVNHAIDTTINAIHFAVMGVPKPIEFGLPPLENGYDYYMHV